MNVIRLMMVLFAITTLGCVDDATDAEKYTKPTVDAGADQVQTLPINSLTLRGSAKTYPKHLYKIKSTRWSQVSGPQQLAILNADELAATVLNPTIAGTYEFEFYAKDSLGRTNTDRVKVILRAAQPIQQAQSTTSYTDDYEAMWNYVATEYADYANIEDKWQQLYQPYWVKTAEASSEETWQKILVEIEQELGLANLTLAQAQQRVAQPLSWEWYNNNGIAEVKIKNAHVDHLDEINQQVATMLALSPDLYKIQLQLLDAQTLGRQTQLMLMQIFSTSKSGLCIHNQLRQHDCITIKASPYLKGLDVELITVNADSERAVLRHFFNASLSEVNILLTPELRLPK